MDKTFARFAGSSEVLVPGRGKYSLRTIADDARVNLSYKYEHLLTYIHTLAQFNNAHFYSD